MKTLRYLLFGVLALSSWTCARTEVSNNVRVLVKGSVVDQENTPLSNAKINIYADNNAVGASEVLLGEGTSQNDGEFEVVSLFGSNALFYITVDLNSDYATYRYQTNTTEFRPEDLVFDLQTVELKALSTFNYSITRTGGPDNTISYSLTYINSFCREVYENGTIDEFQSACYFESVLSRSLNNNIPNVENAELNVPLGSTIQFRYRINEGDEVIETIEINSNTIDFDFTY